MPEFILDGKDKPEFVALPEFVQGFIEAMFFTECAGSSFTMRNWHSKKTQRAVREGQADGSLPCDCGFAELHSHALLNILKFCHEFQERAKPLLELAYERDYDAEQAGRDLWFNSQGHGVGYWSRDELAEGSLGDRLAAICPEHEINPFFGDHTTFGNAPFVHVDI